MQDAAGLQGRPQGPVFGLTYAGRFSPWDVFMLRGSNGKRTEYNKCASPAKACDDVYECAGHMLAAPMASESRSWRAVARSSRSSKSRSFWMTSSRSTHCMADKT